MLRRSVATLVVFFMLVSTLLAADKIVKGTLIKVELKKHQLLLKTDDGKKMHSGRCQNQVPRPARRRERRGHQGRPS